MTAAARTSPLLALLLLGLGCLGFAAAWSLLAGMQQSQVAWMAALAALDAAVMRRIGRMSAGWGRAMWAMAGTLATILLANWGIAAVQMSLTVFFLSVGVGQLLYRPVANMVGRKPPLYFGLGLFTLTSVGCALATDIETLVALRFLQGLGAAAGMAALRSRHRLRAGGDDLLRLWRGRGEPVRAVPRRGGADGKYHCRHGVPADKNRRPAQRPDACKNA